MIPRPTRREAFAATVGLGAAAGCASAARSSSREPFRYCLNTSTIRGAKLPIDKQAEIAGKAGYQGIEVWIRDIQKYAEAGGSIPDLKKKIAGLGLTVESAIGFARWGVDDDVERAKGLANMIRDMDLVASIGGSRIAAPPAGLTRSPDTDLFKIAKRYRAILELGRKTGVVPQVEIWGPSKKLSRIGEAALVAVESGHPDACILLDVYHVFRGGSDFAGIGLINGTRMHAFHMNDYPANPPREELNDSHRVYPGDGAAPMSKLLRTMRDVGFRGALSLELFNREYWKQDPLTVAKTGLEKMRAAVKKALQ